MEKKESHHYINTNYKSIENDKTEVPWYFDKQFSRYWDVYNKCMSYAHKDVLSHCSEIKNDVASALYRMVKAPCPGNFSRSGKKKISSRRLKKRRKQKNRQRKKSHLAAPTPNMFVLMDNDTLQVQLQEEIPLEDSKEVDEEFLAFIETSVKHRIKWNEIKEAKKDEQNSLDISHIVDISEKEHPDIVRNRKMKELYGTSAAKIHGMETAMQLSYDRLSTLHRPAIWPNIPLKLSFS